MARRLKTLWPQGELWRHGDFLKLWSGQTISQVGSQVTALALPLAAVLVLDASAFEVALLGTVEFLPFLLFALPAGVWVDRLRRRPILIVTDLCRGLVLASIPVVYLFDALTMWQLYVVGFLFGICTVFFDVSYQSYLPSLVRKDQLVEGNSCSRCRATRPRSAVREWRGCWSAPSRLRTPSSSTPSASSGQPDCSSRFAPRKSHRR